MEAPTDLFFGDGVPAGDHPGGDAGDGQLFGHHHDVDCRVVPGGIGLLQQVELRGMRNTVSAMKGSRRGMSASRVAPAMRAAS